PYREIRRESELLIGFRARGVAALPRDPEVERLERRGALSDAGRRPVALEERTLTRRLPRDLRHALLAAVVRDAAVDDRDIARGVGIARAVEPGRPMEIVERTGDRGVGRIAVAAVDASHIGDARRQIELRIEQGGKRRIGRGADVAAKEGEDARER